MQLSSLFFDLSTFIVSFFGWRDVCEILFFSSILYYFFQWLNSDTTKHLLVWLYSYLFLLVTSHVLQLTAITFFLLYFSPLALIVLILMHQELLQKNFITYKKIVPQHEPTHDWVELLIQLCLQTINKNKSINIIIEQKDSLKDYFHLPFTLNTPFNTTLLKLLIESEWYDESRFIWLTSTGMLCGINTECKEIKNNFWFDSTLQNYEIGKQNALTLAKKTDALVLFITPSQRLFTLVYQGKVMEQLQGSTALRLIKKIVLSDTLQGFTNDTTQTVAHKPL